MRQNSHPYPEAHPTSHGKIDFGFYAKSLSKKQGQETLKQSWTDVSWLRPRSASLENLSLVASTHVKWSQPPVVEDPMPLALNKKRRQIETVDGSQKEGTTDIHFCDSGPLSVSMINTTTVAEVAKALECLSAVG